jgi:WD40 repeat protein
VSHFLQATVIYRSGRIAKHGIFTLPALPPSYYVNGDVETHCTLLQKPDHTLDYCEDMTFWDHLDADGTVAARFVIAGCDPNRKAWNTVMGPLRNPEPRAYLWLLDTVDHSLQRIELDGYPEGHNFHPLGMEVTPSQDGAPSILYVVNHAREKTTIEHFIISPDAPTQALWQRTLSSPWFVSPNALAITNETSFYVSNDHLMTRRLPFPLAPALPMIESIAGLPLGWLAHVTVNPDGTITHELAALGVAFANGVAISPDGTTLALSSTSLGQVHFYDRNTSTNALKFRETVSVPFFNDNIMFDEEGALIVTGHPHFPSLIAVAANKTGVRAPSWAVSLTSLSNDTHFTKSAHAADRKYDLRAPLSVSEVVPASEGWEVETLFQSDGSVFGTSCTTLRDSRTGSLYMVGLYEEGLMVCKP